MTAEEFCQYFRTYVLGAIGLRLVMLQPQDLRRYNGNTPSFFSKIASREVSALCRCKISRYQNTSEAWKCVWLRARLAVLLDCWFRALHIRILNDMLQFFLEVCSTPQFYKRQTCPLKWAAVSLESCNSPAPPTPPLARLDDSKSL